MGVSLAMINVYSVEIVSINSVENRVEILCNYQWGNKEIFVYRVYNQQWTLPLKMNENVLVYQFSNRRFISEKKVYFNMYLE